LNLPVPLSVPLPVHSSYPQRLGSPWKAWALRGAASLLDRARGVYHEFESDW